MYYCLFEMIVFYSHNDELESKHVSDWFLLQN